jgi:acetyl esterase
MSLAVTLQRLAMGGISLVSAPVLTRVAQLSPAVIEGKRLDPQLQTFAALQRKLFPLHRLSASQGRALYRTAMKTFSVAPRRMAMVEDLTIPGETGPIAARLYVPPGLSTPLPLTVYFHGGGFVLGDVEGYDSTCRYFADKARCAVLSVDYRLAPEHPMPAATMDAGAVWRFLVTHGQAMGFDPARMAVGGDSAGGLLSAMVAIMARDAGITPPCHQLLIYPATDGRMNTRSAQLYAKGFILEKKLTDWFRAQCLGTLTDDDLARLAPLNAERLDGVAPATVVLAGFDPLYDEGMAFAQRLRTAGVPVEVQDHSHMLHGFVTFTGMIPSTRVALDQAIGALRRALWSGHAIGFGRPKRRSMLLPGSV